MYVIMKFMCVKYVYICISNIYLSSSYNPINERKFHHRIPVHLPVPFPIIKKM